VPSKELTMDTVTGNPLRVYSVAATSNSNEAESQGSRPGVTPVRTTGRRVDDVSRTLCQPERRLNRDVMDTPQGSFSCSQ
jgi:hypothetical protein